jgi:hypothetical protein
MTPMTSMTEEEWLACAEPQRLASEVYGWEVCDACQGRRSRYQYPHLTCSNCQQNANSTPRFSARKYRLIGCACCRVIWDDLTSATQRRAVEVAERFAEGAADAEALRQAWQQATTPGGTTASQYAHESLLGTVGQVVGRRHELHCRRLGAKPSYTSWGQQTQQPPPEVDALDAEAKRKLCDAIRDVAGNPFRPVTIEPGWLDANNGQARAIARSIDEEGRFAELPVLADALEDAGCSDEPILTHARQPNHYRGCWLIDAILGKS